MSSFERDRVSPTCVKKPMPPSRCSTTGRRDSPAVVSIVKTRHSLGPPTPWVTPVATARIDDLGMEMMGSDDGGLTMRTSSPQDSIAKTGGSRPASPRVMRSMASRVSRALVANQAASPRLRRSVTYCSGVRLTLHHQNVAADPRTASTATASSTPNQTTGEPVACTPIASDCARRNSANKTPRTERAVRAGFRARVFIEATLTRPEHE